MGSLVVTRAKQSTIHSDTAIFIIDLKAVVIKNNCSDCIFYNRKDFVGPLHESNRKIKAFGGAKHTSTIISGTIE